MTSELATPNAADTSAIEQVVIGGDLSKLTPEQRLLYYRRVCASLGLNPLTKPFDYITLNGKLTLYARKDAADQLRKLNGISIDKPEIQFQDDWIIVTVSARNSEGRADSDIGVVKKTDMQNNLGNALMKAVTKAKRRVTLSICGLGMLDETEIETIPNARPVTVSATGEIVDAEPGGMVETAASLGGEMVDSATALTLERARATLTPKGARLDSLNVDQLTAVIEHPKTPGALMAAAKLVRDSLAPQPAE